MVVGSCDTCGVGDGQVLVQVVLQTDRAGIRGALAEIATFQAIEVVPIDLGGLAARIARRRHRQRNAVIRDVVGFQVVVRQRRAGRRIEAEGDGRRHAPAADVNAIAPALVTQAILPLLLASSTTAERAPTCTTHEVNLLQNPSFESGSLAGWSLVEDNMVVFSDPHAADGHYYL